MKAVLFYPRIEDSFRASYPPLGIMSIATYLNANGHEAIICDRFFETESAKSVLEKHKPDIIGVSVISFSFIKDAIEISETAKSLGNSRRLGRNNVINHFGRSAPKRLC